MQDVILDRCTFRSVPTEMWLGSARSGVSERERKSDHERVDDVGAAVGGGRGRRQLVGGRRGVRDDGDVGVARRVLLVQGHVHVHGAVTPRLPRQLVLLDLQQHPRGQQPVQRSCVDAQRTIGNRYQTRDENKRYGLR